MKAICWLQHYFLARCWNLYSSAASMLEHTQLEWSFAWALLPPFIKNSLGDYDSIYFIAPVMGVHFVFQHPNSL